MRVMIHEKEKFIVVLIEPESHDRDFRLVLLNGIIDDTFEAYKEINREYDLAS